MRETSPSFQSLQPSVFLNILGSALLVTASACTFDSGSTPLEPDGSTPPPPIDAQPGPDSVLPPDTGLPPDAGPPDANECPGMVFTFNPSNIDKCAIPAPSGDLVLTPGAWTLNTEDGTFRLGGATMSLDSVLRQQIGGGDTIRVVSVSSFEVQPGATLFASGRYPLVIVSFDTVEIHDIVSVGAAGNTHGAGGGQASGCAQGVGQEGAEQTDDRGNVGGTGGGGGAYADAGGQGGRVARGNGGQPSGGSGNGSDAITPLRGGCPGGEGGGPNDGADGGAFGRAGGAIQIIAAGSFTVRSTGTITARGGRGGGGRRNSAGGGGGGSGGAILIESPIIVVEGKLIANGGSGGGGAVGNTAGDDGLDGQPVAERAPGGAGGDAPTNDAAGGNGGAGGAAEGDAQAGGEGPDPESDATVANGGGGGGGSVGRIRLNGSTVDIDQAAIISPAHTTP